MDTLLKPKYQVLFFSLCFILCISCKEKIVHKSVIGSSNPYNYNSTFHSEADSTTLMEVTLILKRTFGLNGDELQKADFNSRKTYDRSTFHELNKVSDKDLISIQNFAKKYGLHIKSSDPSLRMMVLEGTTSKVEHAFDVDIKNYNYSDSYYRSYEGEVNLPSSIHGLVESIHGLHSFPLRILKNPLPPNEAIGMGGESYLGYSGARMAELYNFPAGTSGKGQCIGIIALGGGYRNSDLKSYFKAIGQKTIPEIIDVSVGGIQNDTISNLSATGTGEINLDIQVAASAAPGAKFVIYFGQSTKSGFLQTLKAAIHDTINNPDIISISWGDSESNWSDSDLSSFNATLMDAAYMNITVLVASGDEGSTDNQPDGRQHVQFPSSSPFVTSCGGTSFTIQSDTIATRSVWSNFFYKTGGGFSNFFTDVPAYQKNVISDTILNYRPTRGTPDVAGHADNFDGYLVVIDGKQSTHGGTSAVAPLWAALVARLNEKLDTKLGFLNPLIYKLNNTAAFYPILEGNNGDFEAGPIWNPCTALGSPNGEELAKLLVPIVK